MKSPPITLMSPKAIILRKLVVVTSHEYIPAFSFTVLKAKDLNYSTIKGVLAESEGSHKGRSGESRIFY